MEECIALCLDCHEVSLQMVGYLVAKGGEKITPQRVRLLMDCAQVCQTAADFMVRGSPMHGLVCFVCAEVCEASAVECQRFADDPTEAECMDACRRCAESCRQMAMDCGVFAEYFDGGDALNYGEPFAEMAEGARRQGKRGRRTNISDS
jgi:hypothetical protein